MHITSVAEARPYLRDLWAGHGKIGSIHTLGALHAGHAKLISISAQENDHTIVTIYPNKIQLFPGSVYDHNLSDDVALSFAHGATAVISARDEEMYPSDYCTFLDQGDRYRQLNSSVFGFATRGQVTGAIRWICLTRPHRSYFGMKDIEQALMVERAARDLMIDCEIRHVPCIRLRSSQAPISSRLRKLDSARLAEVGSVYEALESGRLMVFSGETKANAVVSAMRDFLEGRLKTFRVVYVTAVDVESFLPLDTLQVPFILHCYITDGETHHFDGLCIRTSTELESSPEVIWLEH